MTNHIIQISPRIKHHIAGWKLIDKMLTKAIDADNEKEAKIFAETQVRQAVTLLKVLVDDPNIYNLVNHDVRYWLNKRFDPELNNNRIVTIVDKIVRLLGGNHEQF